MTSNPTVLIVDDEVMGQKALEALLLGHGYTLVFATNGEEAVRKTLEIRPDLILLDVMMPGMDGFAVCRQLRANSLVAEVPIIMVTALDDQASRLQGIEAGADDFITKLRAFEQGGTYHQSVKVVGHAFSTNCAFQSIDYHFCRFIPTHIIEHHDA